jgi:catechol 2,3-dioxygenase-like lactoylglutathione lyase family enzyme
MRIPFVLVPTLAVAVGLSGLVPSPIVRAQQSASPLPMPRFHHIRLNSVDPERSLAWYAKYWPRGKKMTWGGVPAFYDDIYLLYNRVDKQAPGGFDRKLQRSVPQSAFWTFGSTVKDSLELFNRLSKEGKGFEFLPVYTGPDDEKGVLHSALGPYGDQLLTLTQLKERAAKGVKAEGATGNQDFGYLIDPDGVLVEFNRGAEENFWGHSHFWHEQPLCAANWYVRHLGMQFSQRRDPATGQMVTVGPHNPCDVPIGEVSYPSFIRSGQLRIPIGNVRFANGGWSWYTRQCRFGRCGAGNDQPLSKSKGQVVDTIGLAFPDLDAVIAHLKATGVPILSGPHPLADTRAIRIEDLDGLSLELVEVKK